MSRRALPAGSIVITPVEAAMLYRAAHIRTLRHRHRVGHSALYELLTDISICAFTPTEAAADGNMTRQSVASEERENWTVNQLAKATGRAPRTVRLDIAMGGLPATKSGSTWIVTRRDAETYIASQRRR